MFSVVGEALTITFASIPIVLEVYFTSNNGTLSVLLALCTSFSAVLSIGLFRYRQQEQPTDSECKEKVEKRGSSDHGRDETITGDVGDAPAIPAGDLTAEEVWSAEARPAPALLFSPNPSGRREGGPSSSAYYQGGGGDASTGAYGASSSSSSSSINTRSLESFEANSVTRTAATTNESISCTASSTTTTTSQNKGATGSCSTSMKTGHYHHHHQQQQRHHQHNRRPHHGRDTDEKTKKSSRSSNRSDKQEEQTAPSSIPSTPVNPSKPRRHYRKGGEVLYIAEGLAQAAFGLLRDPVRGAQAGGAKGLVKGVGSGVLGLVARPVLGVAKAGHNTYTGVRIGAAKIGRVVSGNGGGSSSRRRGSSAFFKVCLCACLCGLCVGVMCCVS